MRSDRSLQGCGSVRIYGEPTLVVVIGETGFRKTSMSSCVAEKQPVKHTVTMSPSSNILNIDIILSFRSSFSPVFLVLEFKYL